MHNCYSKPDRNNQSDENELYDSMNNPYNNRNSIYNI